MGNRTGVGERLAVRSVLVRDPGDVLAMLPGSAVVAWVRQGAGLAGWGEAARVTLPAGQDRFTAGEKWLREVFDGADVRDEAGCRGAGPVAFGSFTFDDCSDGSVLIVPETVIGRDGHGKAWLTTITRHGGPGPSAGALASADTALTAPAAPLITPGQIRWHDGALTAPEWEHAVAVAVRRITRGDLRKVVLARDLYAHADRPIDPRVLLGRLAARYPDCYTYACGGLVGATPELLIRRDGGQVRSLVLAGTLPRGATAAEDARLAATLLGSAKENEEHGYAAASVRAALAPLCETLEVSPRPELLTLPNLYHLGTRVLGTLSADRSALALAAALHPTAAVGGDPADVAVELIRELEQMDRGRYAGPVGWMDADGNGEWGIALRCAQLGDGSARHDSAPRGHGRQARLFAGGGIVAGSDPAAELAETQVKFRPVQDALDGDGRLSPGGRPRPPGPARWPRRHPLAQVTLRCVYFLTRNITLSEGVGTIRTKKLAAACGAAALAIMSAACSGAGTTSAADITGPTGGAKVAGGTATYALPPSVVPDYIFPFDASSYLNVANSQYFQYLMYRPLYWFGNGASPTLNSGLSLARPPEFSGRNVTITMKGWKWSDGETVTAQDAVFWIHMMQAVGAADWGGYVPGGFPADVSDVKAASPTVLTMTMREAYNPAWFTDNELSEITPLPMAWDRTASGPSHCATTVSDCAAVYSYLDGQSRATSGWASSRIWSVVDGPWKLAAFRSGTSMFVPNRAYSGPVKPSLAKFEEVPFTTESAEYTALRASARASGRASGAAGPRLDVGYLPTADAPAKPAGAVVGNNPLNGYTLAPLYLWSINYFPLNYQSTTGNAAVLRQLYFRQALQYLVDQKAVISGPMRGYGMYTVGPVGTYPATRYLSPKGQQGNPFPYNPAKARQLLASHGWTAAPHGTSACANPALCGTGVRKGQQLSFDLPYAADSGWVGPEMTRLESSAALAGIRLNLEPMPLRQVTALAAANCVTTHASCDWDMGSWGGGWTFAPDYYPSGEALFLSGSGSNVGGYINAMNDSLIDRTLTSGSVSALYKWQNYLSGQVPVIWLPSGVYELSEVSTRLRGVLPESTTGNLNPENWYFVK